MEYVKFSKIILSQPCTQLLTFKWTSRTIQRAKNYISVFVFLEMLTYSKIYKIQGMNEIHILSACDTNTYIYWWHTVLTTRSTWSFIKCYSMGNISFILHIVLENSNTRSPLMFLLFYFFRSFTCTFNCTNFYTDF